MLAVVQGTRREKWQAEKVKEKRCGHAGGQGMQGQGMQIVSFFFIDIVWTVDTLIEHMETIDGF